MSEHFSDRTVAMLGDEGYLRLKGARVAVFGIGGVGGYAVEALVRAGVGELTLVDSDRVSLSNINRQIIATHDTVGEYKTEAARRRALAINPECKIISQTVFYSEDTRGRFDLSRYDYIIDAIDSVPSKVALISDAHDKGVRIISAMGAGGKLDPTKFKVSDISKTAVCPLAKAVRVALRKRGINHLKVVYSEEERFTPPTSRAENKIDSDSGAKSGDKLASASQMSASGKGEGCVLDPQSSYERRTPPPSVSFVPSVMGLILAGEVIKDISGINGTV